MDEVADDSRRRGPGDRLRTTRERRGLTVKDAARHLRLDPSVIDALEADDFARLSAPIFIKGYLNAYGKLLGLPPDELVAEYVAATDTAPPPLVIRRGTGDDIDSPTSRRILRIGWLVAALVAVAAAAWWYQQRSSEDDAAATTVRGTTADLPVARQEVPLPQRVPEPAPDPTADATSADTPVTDAVPEPVAERVAPPRLNVRLSIREESWVEIVDATGERLYFDLARAGNVIEVAGEPPLAVFLGNSPGVDIEVDGRRFDQSRYNRAGNVARFRLGTRP